MNNDLISRSALIEWIDDSVSQYGHTYSTDMLNMWGLFKDYLINKAPTALFPLTVQMIDEVTDEDIENLKQLMKAYKPQILTLVTKNTQSKWGKWVISEIRCPNCLEYFQTDCYSMEELKKCPACGAHMKGGDAE